MEKLRKDYGTNIYIFYNMYNNTRVIDNNKIFFHIYTVESGWKMKGNLLTEMSEN